MTTFTKFLKDQQEAVEIAQSLLKSTDSTRLDALNVALCLANTRANAENESTAVGKLLADAKSIEEYLRGPST